MPKGHTGLSRRATARLAPERGVRWQSPGLGAVDRNGIQTDCFPGKIKLIRISGYSASRLLELDIEAALSARITIKGINQQQLPLEFAILHRAFSQALIKVEYTLIALRQHWNPSTHCILRAYFGAQIGERTPRFGRIRAQLLANLDMLHRGLCRYLVAFGMDRVALFEYRKGSAKSTVAMVCLDDGCGHIFIDRNRLPPHIPQLAFQAVLLHEVSHFSDAKDDLWYVNQFGLFDACTTLDSIDASRRYSDRLLHGTATPLSENAVEEVFRLAETGGKVLRRWAKAARDDVDRDVTRARSRRAEQAQALFYRRGDIRSMLAVNNADSLAFAVVEIALGEGLTADTVLGNNGASANPAFSDR